MAVYFMPPDTREKEKIIGGLFTWNQAGWLFGAFMLALAVFSIMLSVTGSLALSLIFAFLIGGTLLPFVFVKRNGLTLFQYLMRKHKFNKKTKHLIKRKIVTRRVPMGIEEGFEWQL